MKDANLTANLMKKKRYLSYNLLGHEKQITCIDARNGLIASGSKDNTVKIWDIKRKRAYTFTGHMNWISKVLIWDHESAISASADKSIRFWNINDPAQKENG